MAPLGIDFRLAGTDFVSIHEGARGANEHEGESVDGWHFPEPAAHRGCVTLSPISAAIQAVGPLNLLLLRLFKSDGDIAALILQVICGISA